jgi:hypothetical protein
MARWWIRLAARRVPAAQHFERRAGNAVETIGIQE